MVGEAVADRPSGRQRTLRLEYQFDRLWAEKLAPAYELLAPDKIGPTSWLASGPPAREKEILNAETGRYLRPCILGPPEGEPHDRQPTDGLDRVCRDARIPGSARVALPR